VDTRAEARQRELGALARKLAKLAACVPGHCLVVGPSFAWLAQLSERLRALGCAVVCERAGADEREREAWIEALRSGPRALALAVAGGALTEGFDTAGLGLAAVAVLGPCLPAVEARSELRREILEETMGDGFALAYALPGMTRVIQAVGRLLRRDTDRGVVALYGARFLREPYRSLLPAEWLAGGAVEDLSDPIRVAREFFA
jgi:DNA excision repair protein ERCC-2